MVIKKVKKVRKVKISPREAQLDKLKGLIPLIQENMPTSEEIRCGGALNQEKAFRFGKDPETHLAIREFQTLVKSLFPGKIITLENIRPPNTLEGLE